ncbi:MAG: RimK/LysX family protein [Gammaproteobacteria bacterium]
MKTREYYTLTIVVLLCLITAGCASCGREKAVIGSTASVHINEADLDFIARVDTGAATTSINARIIKVSGDQLEYALVNAAGREARLTSHIIKESSVGNAETREQRYYVYLTITYRGVARKTLVNLNDRGQSVYKFLLGRNWLSGNYVVDVDR